MIDFNKQQLHDFIVKAKFNSYVAAAKKVKSCRLGSNDIRFKENEFSYLDSYFGGTDFLGQEVVYFANNPVWAMNYYGRILLPDIYDGNKAGEVIVKSLSKLYETGRFLGNSSNETDLGAYFDTNDGDVLSFNGHEWIDYMGKKVYELSYHGGLVKD